MASDGGSFVADAFHQVAIAADSVDAVIKEIVAVLVELRSQPALRDGEANRVADALAERAGGGLDSRRKAVLGVSWRLRVPMAKAFDLIQREVVASQVEQEIKQHGRMAIGEDESVASGPMGITRVVPQVPVPEHKGKRRQPHRSARMSTVGLLHRVHRKRTDGVDAKSFELPLRRLAINFGFEHDCGRLFLVLSGNVHLTTHSMPPFCCPKLLTLSVLPGRDNPRPANCRPAASRR